MFEYLSYLEGISFLSEIYRTLKPNAIHGIVVPDLRAFALVYLQDNSFLLQKNKEKALTAKKENYHTNAIIFMEMLHNHGHKMG